jgi:hypothetical protein
MKAEEMACGLDSVQQEPTLSLGQERVSTRKKLGRSTARIEGMD